MPLMNDTPTTPTHAGDRPDDSGARPGLLLQISGPSGVGKTTLIERLHATFDFVFSVSATTRPRSAKEVDGVDYFFLDQPTFKEWIAEDRFLEHAQVFGRDWYGTPRDTVEKQLAAGRIVLLDIDVQGARQVKTHRPDAFGLFILPPSEAVLHKRLVDRKRESPEVIERRFAEAKSEIAAAQNSDVYDALVVNDNLERATAELHTLIERRLQTLRNG
jgi:guanylate kinase